nr:hypothetical protein PFCWREHM_PFCWREHM_CDS_0009 [Microvirus sp.]
MRARLRACARFGISPAFSYNARVSPSSDTIAQLQVTLSARL